MSSTPARPRRAALFVGWIVALVLAASLVPLTSAAALASVNPDGVGGVVVFAAGLAINAALAATIGLILLLRVPGNRVGSLLYASGPLLASIGVGWAATYLFEASGGPSDVRAGLAGLWTGIVSPIAFFVAFTAVGIFFPDGRLPAPSWHQPFRVLVAGFAVSSVLFVIAPWPAEGGAPLNPLALPGVPVEVSQLATAVSTISLIGSFVLATASAIVRWRRSRGVERAQMKWFAFGLGAALVPFLLSWATDVGGIAVGALSVTLLALIPIAIGIAILRYRLYEIDRLVSRTIGWAVVTALLVAVFAALVAVFAAVLAPVTEENTLAVAASTLLAAALFQPLRVRVQRAVDRRFDRARYDGERTAAAFAERLRSEVDLGSLETDLASTVDLALRPSSTGVWIRNVRFHASARLS